jgi:hypothetical protein
MNTGERETIHGRRFWGWMGVAALVGMLVAGSLLGPTVPPDRQKAHPTTTPIGSLLPTVGTEKDAALTPTQIIAFNSTFSAAAPDALKGAVKSTGAIVTPETVQAHLSNYWPPYGDINCDYECAHLANGDRWQKWVGKGLACPLEYPLGTIFVVRGQEWVCIDRGERIVVNPDGTIWLDLLMPFMPHDVAWGSVFTVEVRHGPSLSTPATVMPTPSP